jgi:hypothetical protein
MNQQYRIKGTSFLLWWMAAAVVAWPMVVLLTALITYPLAMFFSMFGITGVAPIEGASSWLHQLLYLIAIGGFLGSITGYGVGYLQARLLQTRLYWVAERWRTWSTAGGALGGILVVSVAFVIPAGFLSDEMLLLMVMPGFVTVLSVFQWLSLRHITKNAWLWILANTVGGIVFSGLIMMNQPPENNINYSLSVMGLWLVATLVQGAITGFVMLHLFENHLLPMETGHPDALEKDAQEKSIWDKAI